MKPGYNIIIIMAISFACTYDPDALDPVNDRGVSIYESNPWYWEYNGQPVVLLGGSYEDNLFQFPNDYYKGRGGMTNWTLEEHLDKLVEAGGNYLRNTMSSRNPGNRFPYLKVSGTHGNNTSTDIYDLDTWDEEYWKRFDHFLNECYKRDIIVQIEIWDKHDLHLTETEAYSPQTRGIDNTGWESHPYNPLRNINYTSGESGLPEIIDYRPGTSASPHPFFYSVPSLSESGYAPAPVVLYYQERYVEKLLSVSLKYNNVLYCMNNEIAQPAEWGEYWIDYVRSIAAESGKNVFCSDMRRATDFRDGLHHLIMQKGEYDFFETSQSSLRHGDNHYNELIYARNEIKEGDKVKPMNNVKIYESGSEPLRRMWRLIFSGAAAARFHRPGYTQYFWGNGLNSNAKTTIRSLRMFTDEMNIFRCEPDNSLLSGRSANEAYCLAEIGEQYAVYFSDGGNIEIDLRGVTGIFEIKWLNIESSQWGEVSTVTGGGFVPLATPGTGQWAVLLVKEK